MFKSFWRFVHVYMYFSYLHVLELDLFSSQQTENLQDRFLLLILCLCKIFIYSTFPQHCYLPFSVVFLFQILGWLKVLNFSWFDCKSGLEWILLRKGYFSTFWTLLLLLLFHVCISALDQQLLPHVIGYLNIWTNFT